MPAAKRFGAAALAVAVCAFVALGGARGDEKQGDKGERRDDKGERRDRGEQAPAPANDREFILMISACGLSEVDAANLAQRQTRNEDLRRLARTLADDHTKANEQLNRLADRKRFPVAQMADQAHQQALTRMAALSGENFDRRFVGAIVRDHERAVNLLEWASKSARDPDVKAWAEKTLPTVREHLKAARDLEDKVGGARRDQDRDRDRTRPGEVDRGTRDRDRDRPAVDRDRTSSDRPDKDRPATDRNKDTERSKDKDKGTTDRNKDTTDKSRDKDK
jgi:putative membrane protein